MCRYLAKVGESFRIEQCIIKQDDLYPDVEVGLYVRANLQLLKTLARGIEDCHVIEESLEENGGELGG